MRATILRRSLLLAASLATVLALAPASASALTLTHQTPTSCDSYSHVTDWDRVLQLPKFNVAGGTLVSATVSREASITSDYRIETLNGKSRTDTLFLNNAEVHLLVPGFASLDASLRPAQRTYQFTAYDGTIDFVGTSGATGGFGTAQDAQTSAAASLAMWIGSGSVSIPASSIADTSSTLSGNFRSEWDTTSTVNACVTYTYTTEILVCIGDYVWYDDNTNGLQQSAEGGVADRTVTVTDAAGNVLATTTTNKDGRWIACGLEPSTACVVSVDLPDGWTVTKLGDGSDPTRDSNGFVTPTGDATIPCVTPPEGQDLTFDVGIYRAPLPAEAPSPTPASMRLTKSSNTNQINSRGLVTFTVRVTNRGQQAVRNLRVCDTPPGQLAFTTRPRGSSMRSGQLCWTVRTLNAKRTLTYRYTMRAANVAARQCVTNRATAVASAGGTASARDNVCIRATRLGVLKLAG